LHSFHPGIALKSFLPYLANLEAILDVNNQEPNLPPAPQNPPVAIDPLTHFRHELRTPVHQIIGFSEMLQEDAESAGQGKFIPDLQKIQGAARHLLDVINTQLSPAGAGKGLLSRLAPPVQTAPPVPATSVAPSKDNFTPTLRGRILAVDDNESNLEMLSRRLRRQGHSVETVMDAQHALQMVKAQPFDLVLLDIMMAGLDGYSALQAMKADPKTRHIPVIMISALDEMDSVVRCIEAGAEDYLPKPFETTLLRARVGACLEKKALRDAEQKHLRVIEETQRRLSEELAEAAHYVRSIFPAPAEKPLRIDWQYQPSTELGGDAFGYHWLDKDHFAVYLLDVCGHGVGASLLSVAAINVIRSGSLPKTDFREPGAVLSALNNAFLMENNNDMYFTLWYGVYHSPSRTLRHSSGGHPPALLLQPAREDTLICKQLRTPGLVIGAIQDTAYPTETCVVSPGAQLFILCDGCYEIRRPDGEMGTFEEFETFMKENGMPPDGLQKLLQWIKTIHGDGPLDDDFSIVRICF
jgi:sigma-B regulation protein RsbU (phosphoserine phosphatase)